MSKVLDINKHKGSFFKVLETTDNSQIAVMTLESGRSSGQGDMHPGDQVVYMVEGDLDVEIKGETQKVKQGELVIIPAKTEHQIYNNSKQTAFFLNIYYPPSY